MHKVVVAHCRYANSPGGEGRSTEAEMALLRSAGHEVDFLELHNADLTRAEAAANCIWSWDAYRRVRRAIAAHRPDIIYFQNVDYYGPAMIRAASNAGCAVIAALRNHRRLIGWRDALRDSYNDSCAQTIAIAAGNMVHVQRTWRRHVDVFVANSGYIKSQHVAAGWDDEQIVVKPNLASFPEPIFDRDREIKRQFVFAGRLVPEKGVGVLLEAWGQLGDDAPELLVIGDGPLRHLFEDEETAHPRVSWLGHRPHARVLGLMAESYGVIVPSTWPEPFGRGVVEAHLCGMPSIATEVGGLPETMPTILVPPGDPEAIATAVRTMLKLPPERYAQWRAEARQRHEEHFSAARQLGYLEGCLDRAIDARQARKGRERLRLEQEDSANASTANEPRPRPAPKAPP